MTPLEFAQESRRAQGLDDVIIDPAALSKIAALIATSEGGGDRD